MNSSRFGNPHKFGKMIRNKLFAALVIIILLFVIAGVVFLQHDGQAVKSVEPVRVEIALPTPRLESNTSVEEALYRRRSVRQYTDEPLTLADVSQLLWAAQGITDPRGLRTAPSAGALYPLEVYLLVGNVEGLSQGIYKYIPQENGLVKIAAGDYRLSLKNAALNQEAVEEAAAVIVIAAVYERTMVKYGDRGHQYVHMEVGSVAQNIYLQAVSLNLGTVFIGAFHDGEVKSVMSLPQNEQPLGLMPVGKKE